MQPGAATKRWPLAGAALLAACAGGEARAPSRMSDDQLARLAAVERAYRSASPEYPAMREALRADPVAVAWLVRMFVRDVIAVREGRPLGGDEELLRAAARVPDPVEDRAVAELRQLGAQAVPTLVGDLLRHEQPHPRELGVELLAEVGQPAVPALQQMARDGAPRHRRAAARALGRIGTDDAIVATLAALAGDPDFAVRADALRSLRGGERAQRLLIERLRADDDPFVRRVAAQTLGGFRSTAAAMALIDHLERCLRERDGAGELAAQAGLQRLAGTRGPRSAAAWREFASRLGDLPPAPAAPAGRGS